MDFGRGDLVYRSDAPADALWIASAHGALRRVPVDLEVVQELSLAPQGDWISYITLGDDGTNCPARAFLDGSGRRQLTSGGSDWNPYVTSDGASVVYTRQPKRGVQHVEGAVHWWRASAAYRERRFLRFGPFT